MAESQVAQKVAPKAPAPVVAAAAASANKKADTVIKTVKMKDGRTVDFAGKRNVTSEAFETPEGNIYLVTDFVSGETMRTDLPASLKNKAAGHGLKQKIHDSFAGEKDVGDMYLAADDTRKQVLAGQWNVKRDSGGFSGASIVLKALVEHTKKSMEQVKEFLQKKLDADKTLTRQGLYASFRKVEKVRDIINRLEAEKASKEGSLDGDAALAELEKAA